MNASVVLNAHTDMRCQALASLLSRTSRIGKSQDPLQAPQQLLCLRNIMLQLIPSASLLHMPRAADELQRYCRYYGVNDPVARKMMERVDTLPKLAPPEDASITTLYIGGLTPVITEDDIRDQFYSYGELQSVKKVCCKPAVP